MANKSVILVCAVSQGLALEGEPSSGVTPVHKIVLWLVCWNLFFDLFHFVILRY